eukprot:588281-Ditylum_brightwellii.AAC.1
MDYVIGWSWDGGMCGRGVWCMEEMRDIFFHIKVTQGNRITGGGYRLIIRSTRTFFFHGGFYGNQD